MVVTMPPGSRRIQILRALYKYGPLSVESLQQILLPPMSDRRLQDAVKRLYDSGLIIRREDSLPGNAARHYQNSQKLKDRIEISKLIGVDSEKLIQPYFRGQELTHSGICALWGETLKRLFPEAYVIRDFHFSSYPQLTKALMSFRKNFELRPDLLLHFPEKNGNRKAMIGIEVEKTKKIRKRLLHKLRKLSTATKLDGVIYLCGTDTIREALKDVYLTQVHEKSIRVRHYSANFLLLGEIAPPAQDTEPKLFNAELQNISLKNWIQFFTSPQAASGHNFYSTNPAGQR